MGMELNYWAWNVLLLSMPGFRKGGLEMSDLLLCLVGLSKEMNWSFPHLF